MTTDIKISRELAGQILSELTSGAVQVGTGAKLRALLAAAVVERQEPVAYADPKSFENFKNLAHLGGLYTHEWMWANPAPGLAALYTSQPAPVSVKRHTMRSVMEAVGGLPGLTLTSNQCAALADRLNAIDKVKELNP